MLPCLTILYLTSLLICVECEKPDMPRFAEPVANVTATVGKEALMACVVENLREYKVAWVKMITQTILSIHHKVVTQNKRVSITFNDHRSWFLHLRDVQETDRGWYMCQINTVPMTSQKGYLQVVVPPRILLDRTSTDVVVREGTEVTLECSAVGYPEPYVAWRREDGKAINYNGELAMQTLLDILTAEFTNNVLQLMHDVQAASKCYTLPWQSVALLLPICNLPTYKCTYLVFTVVTVPPMLTIPNQLEGAFVSQTVELHCHTEAFPASLNYWTNEKGDMIITGDDYEDSRLINGYSCHMTLKIRSILSHQFGSYRCVAVNALGETDGFIKVYEISNPHSTDVLDQTNSSDSMTSINNNHIQGGNYAHQSNQNSPKSKSYFDPALNLKNGSSGSSWLISNVLVLSIAHIITLYFNT
ncbi:lachesin-like [Diaphorina citri]|uniref:Lachesin-like n=1 Tax=Diaphorina citri TaxID=121845 RepID=A0A1S3CV30_DIACI|nr:lachesin-like [Diaphorina citri]